MFNIKERRDKKRALTSRNQNEVLFDNKPAAYAEIIIPLALPMNYTWSLTKDLLAKAKTGVRAEVTLKNKKYAGVIKRVLTEKPEAFDPKPVLNILDEHPVVYPEQLKLWEWMANYYMCSEGEVMQAALPTHFKLSSETILLYNEEAGEPYMLEVNTVPGQSEASIVPQQVKAMGWTLKDFYTAVVEECFQ